MNSNSSPPPLISIVTVCLNRADFIAEAIESVQRQDYAHVEHLVIDGGSTDGTLQILGRYPHLKVVSEPDRGVYDAMNKGIRLACGDIIGLLNSDDLYEDNVLEEIGRLFAEDPELMAVTGKADYFERREGARQTVAEYPAVGEAGASWAAITRGIPVHNAWFFRRSVYDEVGPYDLTYPVAADREFLLRFEIAGLKRVELERVVYHYRQHADSLTVRQQNPREAAYRLEHLKMAERFLGNEDVSRGVRGHIARWHSRDVALLAVLALRDLKVGEAARLVLRGWRYDPVWPGTVVCMALASLGRRLVVRP